MFERKLAQDVRKTYQCDVNVCFDSSLNKTAQLTSQLLMSE